MLVADRIARAGAFLDQGRTNEAEALLAEIGRMSPPPPDWFYLAGLLALQRGNFTAALPLLEQVLAHNPRHALAWNNRGVALQRLGRPNEAEASYSRAIDLDSHQPQFRQNRAACLQSLGRHAEAESLLRALAIQQPASAGVLFLLGVSLQALGRNSEAETSYRQAIAVDPKCWPAALNMANLAHQAGDLAEAEKIYRAAILHHPTESPLLYNLANLLAERSPIPEVETLLRRVLELQPNFASAWINLACHLWRLHRLTEAETAIRRALALKPDSPQALNVLGTLLSDAGHLSEPEDYYRRALQLQPEFPEALANLGSLFRARGQNTEAEKCFCQAISQKPTVAKAYNGLGLIYAEDGRWEEGESMLRRSIALEPNDCGTFSNLLFWQSYLDALSPAEILQEARQWEGHLSAAVRRMPSRLPRRERLRIGYVSPDFRRHAVSYFIGPVLAAHDAARVEVFCYANVAAPDPVTARLQGLVREWHSIYHLSDGEAADLVRRHEIDVLVDLAGHTRHNRLGVFAYKPAPVQATWLGYFASTGLSTMDYWITDEVLHPPPKRRCRL